MLNLIIKKESKDDSFIYLAEISDEQQMELLNALLLYKVVDEWIIYHLPDTKRSECYLADKLAIDDWHLKSVRKYKNNVYRMIYSKR